MNPVTLKIVGILLILVGVAIILSLIISMAFGIPYGPNSWDGVSVAVLGLPTFIIASLLIMFGVGLINYKKEITKMNSNNPYNPMICNNCKQDYDRTWKICLKCGKPLVEK